MPANFNKDIFCGVSPPASMVSFPTGSYFASAGPLVDFPDFPGKGDFTDWVSGITNQGDFAIDAIGGLQTEIGSIIDELSLTFDNIDADMIDSMDFSLDDIDIAGIIAEMGAFNPTINNINNTANNPFFALINMGRQGFRRAPVMPAVTKAEISGAVGGKPGSGPVNLLHHLSDQQPEQRHLDAFENMISQVQSAMQTGDWAAAQAAMNDFMNSVDSRLEEDPGVDDGFPEGDDTFPWIALNIACGEIPADTNVLLSPDQYNNLWVTVAGCGCE
jgi:hypothetical protein